MKSSAWRSLTNSVNRPCRDGLGRKPKPPWWPLPRALARRSPGTQRKARAPSITRDQPQSRDRLVTSTSSSTATSSRAAAGDAGGNKPASAASERSDSTGRDVCREPVIVALVSADTGGGASPVAETRITDRSPRPQGFAAGAAATTAGADAAADAAAAAAAGAASAGDGYGASNSGWFLAMAAPSSGLFTP